MAQRVVRRRPHGSADRERGKEKKGKPKKQPNFFVAVPISNPAIREAAQSVQENIVKAEEAWKPAMVSVRKFHITLMVLRLENEEEIQRFVRNLDIKLILLTFVTAVTSQIITIE